MTAIVVTLVIIGVAFLVASCFVVDKTSKGATISLDSLVDVKGKYKEELTKTLENTLDEITEETINKTEDELRKISNEKIIAVNDFSNQVLEKIHGNHEEVVFLYNMLNDKEEEIKKLLVKVDESKKTVIREMKEDTSTNYVIKKEPSIPVVNNGTSDFNSDSYENVDKINEEESSNNNQIINRYKKGKSVIDIAKELNLGQGEVKLVIDLFVKNK